MSVVQTSLPMRSRERLAWLCILVWTLCSGLSHSLGLWSAVGGGGIALGILVLAADRECTVEQLRPSGRLIGIGVLAGLAMTAATYLLYPLIRHLVPGVVPQTGALYATFGQESGWKAALLLPLVAVAEDIVWRGAVQSAALRRWGPVTGTVAAAAAYCIAVIPVGSPLLVAIALSCGLYWSALRTWTGSLIPPLTAHLLWDVIVFMLWPLAGGQ